MSVFHLPTGATVFRTACLNRHGFNFDVFTHRGEIVELRKEDSRYVKDSAGFIYQLSAEWHGSEAEAKQAAAAELEDGARRLAEQAKQLLGL